ncbi:MAG: pentapeptide repeat-containing protein [Coxiellaceae bacterium]|nr:pentapeptide repeat-containing protein [Coxiellaceae bacterium]
MSRNERKKIRVLSLDFDGCIGVDDSKILTTIDNSAKFIALIKERNELLFKQLQDAIDKTIVMVGSTRQSLANENLNAGLRLGPIRKKYGFCNPTLKTIVTSFNKGNLTFDEFLLADIFQKQAAGTEATRIQENKNTGNDPVPSDKNKLSILYAQLHKIASENPDADIVFDFYDDKTDILDSLNTFFEKNPDLIPNNVTLQLHRYANHDAENNPLEKHAEDERYVLKVLQGTGSIDIHYSINTQLLATIGYTGYEPGENKHSDLVDAFNQHSEKLATFKQLIFMRNNIRGYEKGLSANSLIFSNSDTFLNDFIKEYKRLYALANPPKINRIEKEAFLKADNQNRIAFILEQTSKEPDSRVARAFYFAIYKAEKNLKPDDTDYLRALSEKLGVTDASLALAAKMVRKTHAELTAKDEEITRTDGSQLSIEEQKTNDLREMRSLEKNKPSISDYFRSPGKYALKAAPGDSITVEKHLFDRTSDEFLTLLHNAGLPKEIQLENIKAACNFSKNDGDTKLDFNQWDSLSIKERADLIHITGGMLVHLKVAQEQQDRIFRNLLQQFFNQESTSELIKNYTEKHNQHFLYSVPHMLDHLPQFTAKGEWYPLHFQYDYAAELAIDGNTLKVITRGPINLLHHSSAIIGVVSEATSVVTFCLDTSVDPNRYQPTQVDITFSNPALDALLKGPTPGLHYGAHRALIENARDEKNDFAIDTQLEQFDNEARSRIAQKKNLSLLDLRALNLSDLDLSNKDFRGADFRDADLRGADLRGVNLKKTALDEIIIDDNTKLPFTLLKQADWQSYKHHILDPKTDQLLAEVIVDRKTFDKYYSSQDFKTMIFELYRTQMAETLRVCRVDEKTLLLENYRRFCEIMGKPHDLSPFDLSGNFALTIGDDTKLPKNVDFFTGKLFYEYNQLTDKQNKIKIEIKLPINEIAKAINGKSATKKAAIDHKKYELLRGHFLARADKKISLNELKVLVDAAQKCKTRVDIAVKGLSLEQDATYEYTNISGALKTVNINDTWKAIHFPSEKNRTTPSIPQNSTLKKELQTLQKIQNSSFQGGKPEAILIAAEAHASPKAAAAFHQLMTASSEEKGLSKEAKKDLLKKITEEGSIPSAAAASEPSSEASPSDTDTSPSAEFDLVDVNETASPTFPTPSPQASKATEAPQQNNEAIIEYLKHKRTQIIQHAKKMPGDDALRILPGNISTKESADAYLDTLRVACGLAEKMHAKQKRFSSADTDAIIGESDAVKNGYRSLPVGNQTVYYHFNEKTNELIVLHPTTDIITGSAKDAEADAKAKVKAIAALETQTAGIKESLNPTGDITVKHIIPEVGSGRAREWEVGSTALQENSRHIRLRVVTQVNKEELSSCYDDKKKSQLFDPRDIGLAAQNFGDDVNCGRYVSAMTIQAAGLLRDGLPVTQATLKASPAMTRALHFSDTDNAKIGLENAYVRPLSKDPTPEEIVLHNIAKIQCLKSEYTARSANKTREFHGTNITPFGGVDKKQGYGTATFLTTRAASFFGLAYSATEKLAAVNAIDKALAIADSNVSGAKEIDFSQLPKAARQGELGKCIAAIEKAQAQFASTMKRRI